MDVSEDAFGLEVEFLDDEKIEPAEEFEEEVADERSCGIQDYVIDVDGTEGNVKDESHYKLGIFKGKANGKNKPRNVFRSDLGDETDSESEWDGEKNVFKDVPYTRFRQVVEAGAKVEGNEV